MLACRKFAITFQLDFALVFVCLSLYGNRIYPNAAALPNIELQQRVQEFAELFIELLPHEATMPNCNPIVNYPSTLPSAFLPFALAADSEESLQRARYPTLSTLRSRSCTDPGELLIERRVAVG